MLLPLTDSCILGPFRINSVNLAYPVASMMEERLLKAERSSQNVPFVMSIGILTTFPRREEQDMFPCQPQKGG